MVARAFYWLAEHQPDAAEPFAHAAFAEHFVHEKTLVTSQGVRALAGRFIGDTTPLAAWLASQAAKDALRAMTEQAVAKGVFGSPFFIADGEPFWGWDRIPMLEDWLAGAGWSPAARRLAARRRRTAGGPISQSALARMSP